VEVYASLLMKFRYTGLAGLDSRGGVLVWGRRPASGSMLAGSRGRFWERACGLDSEVAGGWRHPADSVAAFGAAFLCVRYPRVALRFTRGNTILSPPSGLGNSFSGLSPGSARSDSLHRRLIARAAPSARWALAAWGEGETPESGFRSCLGRGLGRWIHGGLPGEASSRGSGSGGGGAGG
jgi:hypothetical protein